MVFMSGHTCMVFSLIPRLSSRAVHPLPEKIRPGKTYHVTGRKEVERA